MGTYLLVTLVHRKYYFFQKYVSTTFNNKLIYRTHAMKYRRHKQEAWLLGCGVNSPACCTDWTCLLNFTETISDSSDSRKYENSIFAARQRWKLPSNTCRIEPSKSDKPAIQFLKKKPFVNIFYPGVGNLTFRKETQPQPWALWTEMVRSNVNPCTYHILPEMKPSFSNKNIKPSTTPTYWHSS